MKKKIFAVGLAVCVMLTGCGNEDNKKDVPELLEPAMSISNTVKVEKGSISNEKIYKADIIPYTEEYSFDMAGSVDKVYVKEGDYVKKGDKLAVLIGGLDNTEVKDVEEEISLHKSNCEVSNLDAEYDIKIMKLERELLKEELNNASKEEKKKLKNEYDIKTVDIKIAEQSLKNTKEIQAIELKELQRKRDSLSNKLGDYYLYADMDGIVSFVNINENDMVEKGMLAIAISDIEKMHVRSDYVSQKEYNSAKSAKIECYEKEYTVTMRPVDMTKIKEMLEAGYKVSSHFDIEGQDENIILGECVDLKLEYKHSDDTLYLPLNAVYLENEESYVYVSKDGRRVRADVEVGISNSTYIEIVSGLKEGDDVYVKP